MAWMSTDLGEMKQEIDGRVSGQESEGQPGETESKLEEISHWIGWEVGKRFEDAAEREKASKRKKPRK